MIFRSPPPFQRKPRFHRDLLPSPIKYYSRYFKKKELTGEWAKVNCPFHQDSTPSFTINTQEGYFKCFGCHIKGGDIVAFHMEFYYMDFKEACKSLGAWK